MDSSNISNSKYPLPKVISTRTAALERIISTAESLFAERGIEGVSMREISAAVGSKNKNLVQYHFSNIEGLIRAIYRYRVGQMEEPRGRFLAEVETAGGLSDPRALLEALFLPQLRFRNLDGKHSFVAFHAQYIMRYHTRGVSHPVQEIGTTLHALNRLRETLFLCIGSVPRVVAEEKLALTNLILLGAVTRWDWTDPAKRTEDLTSVLDRIFDAMAAFFCSPLRSRYSGENGFIQRLTNIQS